MIAINPAFARQSLTYLYSQLWKHRLLLWCRRHHPSTVIWGHDIHDRPITIYRVGKTIITVTELRRMEWPAGGPA